MGNWKKELGKVSSEFVQTNSNSKCHNVCYYEKKKWIGIYDILSECHNSDEMNYLMNVFRFKKKNTCWNRKNTPSNLINHGNHLKTLFFSPTTTKLFSSLDPEPFGRRFFDFWIIS